MQNHRNYIISLGNLCRRLAEQAEKFGVEIFPGFAAAEVLYDERGAVTGVATGDMGVGKDGKHTANYAPGVELYARQTIFVNRRAKLGLTQFWRSEGFRRLQSARPGEDRSWLGHTSVASRASAS